MNIDVSIPNRDFGELQSWFGAVPVILVIVFQSLIGILVNCNQLIPPCTGILDAVSIPNRDFGELQ